jgi:hypothetical protein
MICQGRSEDVHQKRRVIGICKNMAREGSCGRVMMAVLGFRELVVAQPPGYQNSPAPIHGCRQGGAERLKRVPAATRPR